MPQLEPTRWSGPTKTCWQHAEAVGALEKSDLQKWEDLDKALNEFADEIEEMPCTPLRTSVGSHPGTPTAKCSVPKKSPKKPMTPQKSQTPFSTPKTKKKFKKTPQSGRSLKKVVPAKET